MKEKPHAVEGKKRVASSSSLRLALENRLLFDGAVVATTAQAMDDKAAQDQLQAQTQDNSSDPNVDSSSDFIAHADSHSALGGFLNGTVKCDLQQLVVTPPVLAGDRDATSLLVIDSRADGIQELLKNPPLHTDVRVIDASRDGYEQIKEILHDRGDTARLNIHSTELDGKQYLGSSSLLGNLNANDTKMLIDWGDGLSANASINFHGGHAIVGKSWLNQVQALTGGQARWSDKDASDAKQASLTSGSQDSKTTTDADKEKTGLVASIAEIQEIKALVFIDTSVKGYQALLKDIDPNATVILLDLNKDGVQQMVNVVSEYDNIDAIHIISHGDIGQIKLGSSVLKQSTIQGMYAEELASMRGHLSANADILIYGCSFGQGEIGIQLTKQLAALTGADVADSTNLTGSADLGGDWILENQIGMIEAQTINAPAWNGLLTTSTTLDWQLVGDHVMGSTGTTYTLGTLTNAVTIKTTGTGSIVNDYTADYTGGTNDPTLKLSASTISTISGQTTEINFNSSAFPLGVLNTQFDLRNIDAKTGSGAWDDRLILKAFDINGVQLSGANISATPRQTSGQTYSIITNTNNVQLDGNTSSSTSFNLPSDSVNISITPTSGAAIGKVTILYVSGTSGTTTNSVGLSDIGITFDKAPLTNADTGSVAEDTTLTKTAANGVIQGTTLGSVADSDPDDATNTLAVSGVKAGTGTVTQGVGVGSAILGTYGHLTLSSDGSYSYIADNSNGLAAGATATDTFTYTIKDPAGVVSNATTLTITVTGTNDPPVLTGDLSATVLEGGTYVLTAADLGFTDPDNVAAVETFTVSALANGTLLVNGVAATSFTGTQLAAGQVSFRHDGSETTSASFLVNVEDANQDGSASVISTFNFAVTPVNDVVTYGNLTDNSANVANTDAQVFEKDLPFGSTPSGTGEQVNGSFTLGPITSLTSFTLGGATTTTITAAQLLASGTSPITRIGAFGTLVINGYNPATSVVNYSYTLTSRANHNVAIKNEVYGISTIDVEGDINNSNSLRINIVDDAPFALPDNASVTEDGANPIVGNVFGNDKIGADDASTSPLGPVTSITNSVSVSGTVNGITPLSGLYGSLTISTDGAYSYTLDNANPTVYGLNTGQTLTETYAYQITDKDGDTTNSTLTITINGTNEPTVSSISDTAVTEGGNATQTFTLSGATSNPTSYPLVIGGSAAAGIDYGALVFSNGVTYDPGTGLLSVPAGVSVFTVTYPASLDTLADGGETVTFSSGGNTGTGTINDPAAPTVSSISDTAVTEGGNATQTFTLSGATSNPTSYPLVIGGSAAAGIDYGALVFSNGVTYDPGTGLLSVPAGVSVFTVTYPASLDTLADGGETVTFSSGGNTGTGTINDPAAPTVSSISDTAVTEGGNATQTFTLSGATSNPTSYPLVIGGSAAAGIDYGALVFSNGVTYDPGTGLLSVPAGVSVFTVTYPASLDTLADGGETVTFSSGGNTGTGTINDPAAPTVSSISDTAVTEGGNATQTFTLSGATSNPTSYPLVIGGSAAAGIDYGALVFSNGVTYDPGTGLLSVPAGVSVFTVTYPASLDTLADGGETVTFSSGGNTGTGTINDPAAPTVSSISDTAVTEGGNATQTFTLSGATSNPTSYPLVIGGSAAAGIDYGALVFSNGVTYDPGTGLLSVPAGVSVFTVTYPASLDTLADGGETVTFSSGGNTGTGIIIDNVPESSNIGSIILLSNPTPPLFSSSTTGGGYSLLPFREINQSWSSSDPYRPSRLSLYGDLRDYELYLTASLYNQVVLEMQAYSFSVPPGAFRHTNPNEQLEYKVSQVDGSPLPSWLHFDDKQLKFSGIPPKGAMNIEVLITAKDRYGNEAYANFKVTVNKGNTDNGTSHNLKLRSDRHARTNIESSQYSALAGRPGFGEQLGRSGKMGRLMESRAFLDMLQNL